MILRRSLSVPLGPLDTVAAILVLLHLLVPLALGLGLGFIILLSNFLEQIYSQIGWTLFFSCIIQTALILFVYCKCIIEVESMCIANGHALNPQLSWDFSPYSIYCNGQSPGNIVKVEYVFQEDVLKFLSVLRVLSNVTTRTHSSFPGCSNSLLIFKTEHFVHIECTK